MALAFDRVGRGPVLVLLHPLGADRKVWAPVIEGLRGERELLAVDLPGFGESDPLATTPTPAALAAAVAGLLAELGIDRPHIAGISLGGWVALELGRAGCAATTTAIAPAGLWTRSLLPKPTTLHTVARLLSPLIRPLVSPDVGRRLLLGNVVAHPDRVPAADAAHLVRAWARAPGFVDASREMRAGRFEGLAEVDGPVTLVWPAHDRLVRRPRQTPDNVRNVELPDAGHVPTWDAPDAVAEILLAATSGSIDGSDPARIAGRR